MKSEDGAYHHGNLDEALIEETTRMIREDGLGAVSMRKLSDRLDVSRSAAYRHFDSQSDLYAEVARRGFLELRDELQAVRKGADPSSEISDRLLVMGRTYVQFALDNPAFYRLMFQWNWSEDQFEELSSAGEATFDELVTTIEIGQDDGTFRSGDAGEMAFSTWSLVHGIALLALEGHAPDDVEDEEKLTSMLAWLGSGLLSD